MNLDYNFNNNFDYNFGYTYNKEVSNKNRPGYSFNDQIKYVPIDNSKKCDKDKDKDKDKEKKFGCCCDTDSLRKLLLFFSRNNIPIVIFTETFPFFGESPENLTVYVNSIVGNLVYVSRESNNGPVIALIPLCEIDHVALAPDTPNLDLEALINKIICKPTLEKDDCCCIKGVGDTISCVSNINLLFPFTDAILLESNEDVLLFILLVLFFFQNNTRAFVNDDLYILITETETFTLYFITPICNIDHFAVIDNLTDENGLVNSSIIPNSILSLFNNNIREKLKNVNINELIKEVRGMSFKEALKKFNSALS